MADTNKIAVSGARGFIGSKLCEVLNKSGYEVWPLVRHKTDKPQEIFYDYNNKKIDQEKLAQCSAVIHLAGKNIMGGLWTKSFKKELYDSRVKSTRFIAHTLAQLKQGPKTLLNASAIGIYGDRADQKLDEDSLPGQGFLADLCVDWERGTLFAKKAGVRVVNMRTGIVLDPEGGMLKSLMPIFKLGLGSFLGSGSRYISYVTRDQIVAQMLFILKNSQIEGPTNLVSLKPTTNEEFTKALAKVAKRPVWLKIPSLLLKLLGDQGRMTISSARVYPKVLLDNGFLFEDMSVDDTLAKLYR
jgi:uncharacterized protein